MKIGVSIFLFIISSTFSYAQFNSVSNEIKLNSVGLFVAPKKAAKTEVKTDTLLLLSIKNQKEALETILSKDTLKSDRIEPLIYLPLDNVSINSFYGYRYHPIDKVRKFHYGVDLQAKSDTVYSIIGGIVKDSGYSKGLGYYVKIEFKEYEFIYGHLSQYYVLAGQRVYAGQRIGKTGSTGKSTGEHLHFAVKRESRFINPISFINQ